MTHHDAIVCGGGPAGVTAALWLGRYRRATLVVDSGQQRNRWASASHGYLGRDGASPHEILEAGLRDIARYNTVQRVDGTVNSIERTGGSFTLQIGSETHSSDRLLLATGVEDVFPDVPGFEQLYGKSIHHCSCCDGYEARDQDVIAIGWGEHVAGYALDLLNWGARVTLVTNGRPFQGDDACHSALGRNDVEVLEEEVVELLAEDGGMKGARLASGRVIDGTKAFFSIEHRPRTDIAVALGCKLDDDGYIAVGPHGETSVDNVYAAGDVTPGEQLIQTAAAKGAVAGIACAMSIRGAATRSPSPDPGPDPKAELAP